MSVVSYINANDRSVAVRSAGSGQPVVLLHSSASSSAQWRDTMADMAPVFRVLAPDFPGYGKSACWSGTAPRTLATDSGIVAAIADDCREPIHLVGHSYGGAVALWYAMRHPATVKSLTLIEPVAFNVLRFGGRGRRFLFDEINEVATTVVNALSRGDHFSGMAHFIDYWNGRGTWDQLPHERQEVLAAQIENIAQEFSAVFDDPRSTDAYEDLQVPTQIIRGDQSRVPAMSVAASLARAIPSAALQTIEGAGHMLPLTHKASIKQAISQHIERHAHTIVNVPALPQAA